MSPVLAVPIGEYLACAGLTGWRGTGTLTFASRVRATELGGASKGTQSAKKAALNAVLGMSRMKASSGGSSGGSGDASTSAAEESLWLSPSGGAPKSPQPRSRSVDSPPVRAAAQLSPAKTPEAEAEAEASEEPQRRSPPKAPGSPPARKQNLDHLLNAGAPSSPAPPASKSGSFTVFVDDEPAAGKGKARAPGGGLYAKVTALEAAERDKENEKVKLPFIGSDDRLLTAIQYIDR